MEGLIEGIPSVALSLISHTSKDFQPAAKFAKILVDQLAQKPLPDLMLLNVNIPALKWEEIAGVTLTRQGVRRYIDVFDKRVDPRGKTYYWLTGEVIEDVEPPTELNLLQNVPLDVHVVRKNYISITPLQYNLTYADGLNKLSEWEFNFP